MREWLRETHGVKFELVRHFLARMFDSELFSATGQWQSVAVGAFATIFPAFLLFGNYGAKYGRLDRLSSPVPFRSAAVADELSLLVLVMSLSALVALMQWQALFPSKRDYFALAALPVRSRQIFTARFIAVFIFITALILTANLLPSVAIPIQIEGHWAKNQSLPANIVAYGVTACLACYFVFIAVMALQGLLLHLLPRRMFARLSVYVQGLGMAVFFLAALFSWTIGDWSPATVAQLPRYGAWAPPVWFTGLHEWMLGDRSPFFTLMKSRAAIGFAAVCAITLVTYILGYTRYRKLLVEVPDIVEAPRHLRWSLLRPLASDPRTEAAMQFMAKTLARSRLHRVVLLGYIGLGVGFAANALALTRDPRHLSRDWYEVLQFAVLFWPVALTAVLLPGFRHACSMPAELRANWIFRATESLGRAKWMAGVERFIIVCVVGPIYLLLAPIAVSVLGWPLALRMLALQVLVSLTMFEVLFADWQKLPFTCSYLPGKRPVMAILARALLCFGALIPLIAIAIRAASFLWQTFLLYAPVFLGVWWWARRRRLDGWGEVKLIYEDFNEIVPQLGISELSYRPSEVLIADAAAAESQSVSYFGSGGDSGGSTTGSSEPPIDKTLRLYRTIAGAFPREFKDSYGDELLQVTDEAIESIWQRRGRLGLVWLLADIIRQVVAENIAQFGRDIRYGCRTLFASPAFTAVAVVSLALGICIATCALSEMNGMVLRSLPGVARAGELVGFEMPLSYPDYKRYAEREDVFSSTAAYVAPAPVAVSIRGHNERFWAHLVSASYFATYGVQPFVGSFFDPADDQPGGATKLVVSYAFWRDRMASDRDVVGRSIRINGTPFTISGVGPRDFLGASPALFMSDMWLPIGAATRVTPELANNVLDRRDRQTFRVVGRLRPFVTEDRAESELDAIARQIERDNGEVNASQQRRITLVAGGKLLPLRKQDLPFFSSFLLLMAGLVMTIACANVANMMLARAAERRREIAVRLALGASRWRVVRQLLSENMLVAVAGGVLGFMTSAWLMQLLSQLRMPAAVPVSYDFRPDARVLLFTTALTLITGFFFGLAPALQATRANIAPALKTGAELRLKRLRIANLRNLLMVAQVAASLTLLVVLGLMSFGIQRTLGIRQGFNVANLYLISIDPVRDGYAPAQAKSFYDKLMDRVRALPAIDSATITESVPMSRADATVSFRVQDHAGHLHQGALRHLVGAGYFETAGIPLLSGRAFRVEDETDDSPAVVVSASLAQSVWPGEDAVGRTLEVGGDEVIPARVLPGSVDYRVRRARRYQVVGVAGDIGEEMIVQKPRPAIYFPLQVSSYSQPSVSGLTLLLRAKPGTNAIDEVRAELSRIDANVTPFDARTMTEQIQRFMSPLNAARWTYGLIGIFGVALAGIGLAGVTAYTVARRRFEIGVRVAMGAPSRHILRVVLRDGVVLIAIGLSLGMAGALAASRALAAMNAAVGKVTSTGTTNPTVMLGAPLLLAALALTACYIPARSSLRISPIVALRQE